MSRGRSAPPAAASDEAATSTRRVSGDARASAISRAISLCTESADRMDPSSSVPAKPPNAAPPGARSAGENPAAKAASAARSS